MSHRAWWLVISTIVLLCIALAVQDGLRRAARGDGGGDVATAGPVPAGQVATATAPPAPDVDTRQARNDAMRDAVSTVHAYVALLFKSDRSEADAMWADGRVGAGEANLRTLDAVTGVRVDNATPEPLDALPVPAALRIPVRLRVGGQGPLRHYAGHYDLRRDAGGWRIAAASIDPSPVGR